MILKPTFWREQYENYKANQSGKFLGFLKEKAEDEEKAVLFERLFRCNVFYGLNGTARVRINNEIISFNFETGESFDEWKPKITLKKRTYIERQFIKLRQWLQSQS